MNVLYSYGRQGFLEGSVAWVTDTIRAILVDTDRYTFSDNHQYLADVPDIAQVAISNPLTAKTTDGGVADAADVTFTAVTGETVSAIILYKQGSGDADSRLLAYIDTVQGLPANPDGSNISIAWDNTPSRKIFKL